MIFNPRFKIYIVGYNTFMKNVKNLKFIIIAIVVVAVLICGVLVADKTGLFEEETTTEPVTLATTKITFIEGITLTEAFKLLEQNKVCSYDVLMNTAQNYGFTDYKIYGDIPAGSRNGKRTGGCRELCGTHLADDSVFCHHGSGNLHRRIPHHQVSRHGYGKAEALSGICR